MKERPILFSAPMVRAILGGSKTQTRRVVKPQPPSECSIHYMLGDESWLSEDARTPLRHNWEAWHGPLFENRPPRHMAGMHSVRCPYGKPGDRLWVRETFALSVIDPDGGTPQDEPDNYDVLCRATDTRSGGWTDADGNQIAAPWKPSIHMPRRASRILLEITSVRVERLQDISEEDAVAEGITLEERHTTVGNYPYKYLRPAMRAYRELWEQINGAGSWSANPWVWVIEFRRIDTAAHKGEGR